MIPSDNRITGPWEKYKAMKRAQETMEEIRGEVAEVIQEVYGIPVDVTEAEVSEFCRLVNFREYMCRAFVPSKLVH